MGDPTRKIQDLLNAQDLDYKVLAMFFGVNFLNPTRLVLAGTSEIRTRSDWVGDARFSVLKLRFSINNSKPNGPDQSVYFDDACLP